MTTKRSWLTALLLSLGCLTMALPSWAAPPRPQEKSDAELQAEGISEIITAYQLAEFGRKYKSPEALMTAAGLFRKAATVKLGEIKEKPTTEYEKDAVKGDPALEGTAKSPDFAEEANRLLNDAGKLAAELKLTGMDGMMKMAREREYKEEGTRGAVGGPKRMARAIGGGQTETFHIPFQAGQSAVVGVHASTPLQVTVVGQERDNVVAAGVIANGQHQWTPKPLKSGASNVTYTIKVKNIGKQAANYTLFTN